MEQLSAAAAPNNAVIDAVRRKAPSGGALLVEPFWWSDRHSGFNNRLQKPLNRLLDAEPEDFVGSMTLLAA